MICISMKRITISVPDDVAALVAREARRTGRSVSAVVGRALSERLGGGPAARRKRLPFAAVGRSGRRHTARDAEKIIDREWGRGGRRRGR